METEMHVAQHSRREKLRVQNVSNGEIYTTHFDQEGSHLNSDFAHLRSFRYGNMPYEPLVFPSPEAVNFGLDVKDVSAMMMHHGSVGSSAKTSSEVPQSCSTWKSIAGGHGSLDSDWIADGNSNPSFVGQGLGSLKSNYNQAAAVASSAMYGLKPTFQDYNASSLYHNPMITHQEMGYVAISQQNNREGSSVSWANGGNGSELVLLPSYADRGDQHCDSINRQVDERYHRWNGDLQVYSENKNGDRDGSNAQALSLSLSSIPLCNNRMVPENLHLGSAGHGYGNMINNQDVKIMKSEQLCFDVKGSCNNGKGIEGHDNDQHNAVGNSSLVTSRSVGPLGPFTGYATILKSSRFLKPAQQLLDDFCNMLGPKSMKIIHLESPDHKLSSQTNRNDSNDMNATDSVTAGGAFGGDSGGSCSTFYSSNNNNSEKVPEFGGLRSSTHESYRPEILQKKAKLLYMLEEVCRRYKQYNQQMQMVVSAFETVAGLSAATPYISEALKSISRHFRCLRTAISDQLKSVRKALGEDLLSPTTGTSCSSKGGDTSISSRLKLMDQALHINQKAPGGGGNMGFFEAQQHVWRPQRGLPERAVAILRAWLFDHFLHPYPTDADKHMLATQTGLSRNQVSNWFINARVRVWKPMVEEIHMLETKGSPETSPTAGNKDIKANHGAVGVTDDHIQSSTNRLMNTGGFTEKQVEYPGIGSSGLGATRPNMDDWNLKRSRVECHTGPGGTTMDGPLVGFAPYQQTGIDIGSLGAVSLTLGLRRNADGVQQPQHHHHHDALQQQQQQHQHQHQQPHDHNQLRRHYGDQIIYDFVG